MAAMRAALPQVGVIMHMRAVGDGLYMLPVAIPEQWLGPQPQPCEPLPLRVGPMTQKAVYKAISAKTGIKLKVVKAIFRALKNLAASEIAKTEKFVIPKLFQLKLKDKAATKASKRMVFGQKMNVQAKPAKKVLKAFAAKALKLVLEHSS